MTPSATARRWATFERRLLLAALVAVDLALVDAGRGGEPGLREPGLLAQATNDLAEVGLVVAAFHRPGHLMDEFVVDKMTN